MSFPIYPKYKDSGVEWLGKLPEHWHVAALKRGYSVTLGKMLQPEKAESGDEFLPYIRAANIQWSGVDTADIKQMWVSTKEKECLRLETGDLLVSEGGDVGRSCVWRGEVEECYFQNSVNRVRPLGDNSVEYLRYWISTIKDKGYIDVLCNKSTIAHFTAEKVEAVPAAFPPADEQRAIAAFLDRETSKIDALVAEQRRLIELLKEKRQAVISNAVTKGLNHHGPMKPSGIEWLGDVPVHWQVTRVKSASTFVTSGPRGWSERISETGTLFIQSGDLNDSLGINFTEAKRVNVDVDAEAARTRLIEGDVVLCVTGAKTGNVAVVSGLCEPAHVNQHLCLIRPTNDILPSFLGALLKGNVGKTYFELSQYGLKQGLSLEDVKNAVVLRPPLAEQRDIVAFIEDEGTRFNKLIEECTHSIALLQERRTALVSAAVTGRIDARKADAGLMHTANTFTTGFARQLLAAEILQTCHAHPTTGRVKLQKLLHLCEHVAEIEEIHASYERKAAGPFDQKMMFGIAKALKQQRWFLEQREGGRVLYKPLDKAGEHTKYLTRWEAKMPRVRKVLELLGNATTRQCEIVSTLYAAWNDLLIEGKSPTDAEIIFEASDAARWHASKSQIPADKWPAALKWMRKNGLVPRGFGSHTKRGGPSGEASEASGFGE